ncbi:hypothetical protein [Methanogenium cariaci]|uniref:hypothetical protein n=1 Tax=Methanogenium cariaci TaxID=2197 RepID=UPI00078637A7|nr:hypothetical protein [Methanogenium cariaci]
MSSLPKGKRDAGNRSGGDILYTGKISFTFGLHTVGTLYILIRFWSMSQTFQFIAARAKEYPPQVIRRNQMSKQAFLSGRTNNEEGGECIHRSNPRTHLPIISA